ncbi:hypothetical protein [Luteibacter sp. 621]|uniref:hypothetical protein n=1 Tax=Luteibacter sp. 621 TaxID=3373916 RepID=UPI003D197289
MDVIRRAFDFDARTCEQSEGELPKQQVYAAGSGLTAFYPIDIPGPGLDAWSECFLDALIGIADAQAASLLLHGEVLSGVLGLSGEATCGAVGANAGLTKGTNPGLPVFAIDAALLAHADAHAILRGHAHELNPVASLVRTFSGQVRGQPVSFSHLDYMRVCMETVDWPDSGARLAAFEAAPPGPMRRAIVEAGYQASVRQWLLAHAARITMAFSQASVVEREAIEWLAGYHNVTVKEWGGDALCLCILDPEAEPTRPPLSNEE